MNFKTAVNICELQIKITECSNLGSTMLSEKKQVLGDYNKGAIFTKLKTKQS